MTIELVKMPEFCVDRWMAVTIIGGVLTKEATGATKEEAVENLKHKIGNCGVEE